jgi:lauroyl/myristoyl acyltransferase
VTRKLLRRGAKALKGISAKDLVEVVKLSTQGALAWVLPEKAWWPVSRLLGRLEVATHPTRTRKETAHVAALIAGTQVVRDPSRVVMDNWGNQYGERFQYLRAWRPGGWSPEIDIKGGDHVSAALDRGRGIIFWGGHFSFNNLVAKMAMHRFGLAVIGFSVPLHGISKTAFGVRYLNRLYRDVENLYLGERLMVARAGFAAALQRMRDCLKDNGAVYFAVGGRGRRTATARFLGGQIIVATGPLAMAHTMGAGMLPVHTYRAGPSRYEVNIGPPIEIPTDADGNADFTAAVQAYADGLAPFVVRDPGQWRGWRLINARVPWGGAKELAAKSEHRNREDPAEDDTEE